MPPNHEALADIARGLMKQPEMLATSATPSRLILTTVKSDYPRLVGKHGRHIQALEMLGATLSIDVVLADPVEIVTPNPTTLKEPEDLLASVLRNFDERVKTEKTRNLPAMKYEIHVRTARPIPENAQAALDTLIHGVARTSLVQLEIVWP
jgi:predicted RNA-binding protein YlqC (UPF0109 family)